MGLKKKVVVIGGTGFIGTYLIINLSKSTDIDLSVLYKNIPPQIKLPKVNYCQVNKIDNNKRFVKIISDVDCLILLNQPDDSLIKSITKSRLGIKRIIYASTLLLYKDSCYKQKEDSPLNPITDYEYKKYKEEKLLSSFAKKQETKLCILRLANVYGDIKNKGIIQKIFIALMEGKTLNINGNGEQKRDYIFVEDVVNILESLVFSNQKNIIDVFNICSGRGYTINKLITNIEKITHKKLLRCNGTVVAEKKIIIGDNNKIIKYTNQPLHFSLLKGLRKTYENYLKQYEKIN